MCIKRLTAKKNEIIQLRDKHQLRIDICNSQIQEIESKIKLEELIHSGGKPRQTALL